ncbi:hypothetical protein B9Z55_016060 [Caenorhabditis nigoni]|uniref:F-box domain-containing protein n=1 Tax=Caenorhabditis nigoni TaxID=1611254 RepID=A0A2G5UCZ9_9PELO|nr:hypothetical protein B9Z55_016060 [Caenorhabditis nigoni]
MPFPILRTPVVVLSEIISLLEPSEIVTSSFCSKNVRRLLKSHYQRRKLLGWRLFIKDYTTFAQVYIVKPNSKFQKMAPVISAEHITKLKGHSSEHFNGYKRGFSSEYPSRPVPINLKSYLPIPVLYFEDRAMVSETIVSYVTDLLNLDISGLLMVNHGIWAIDWIKHRRQEKMLETLVTRNGSSDSNADEALDHVLRNARAERYILCNEVSENFRFNGKLGPMQYLLTPGCGYWVTVDNLMNFDSINIKIEGCKLSVSDLNSFLRHWRAGGSHRLTFLDLGFRNDINFEFDEDLEVVETNEVVEYYLNNQDFNDGETIELRDGYSIQRADGVKARIGWKHMYYHRFLMIVQHEKEIESTNQLS